MKQRLMLGSAEPLADDEVAVVAITSELGRDGNYWDAAGIDMTNYRRNPVVLYSHDPMQPIGVAALALSGAQIEGRIRFAPAGLSECADMARGLCKSGVLSGVSAGIDVLDAELIDPAKGRAGGMIVNKGELLEISLVAIPADPGARVVARALRTNPPPIDQRAFERFVRSLPVRLPVRARIAPDVAEAARRIGRAPAYHADWRELAARVCDRNETEWQQRKRRAKELEVCERAADAWRRDRALAAERARNRDDADRRRRLALADELAAG